MKFVDETIVKILAGHGGAGSRHFRREKFVEYGGPDGGDGGKGGSVYLVGDSGKQTLLDFHFRAEWKASDGESGGGSRSSGKQGKSVYLRVPLGTQAIRIDNGELAVDVEVHGKEYLLAAGGRGGKGNAFFKTSTHQAPDYAQPGEEGQKDTFKLSLKLIADIGIIGFPNAGKSTFIRAISDARPTVADYPFTTLVPNLGASRLRSGRAIVVADIPGLIPGAHVGKGLGITFLKHIERTSALAHLVDLTTALTDEGDFEPARLINAYNQINQELGLFSAELIQKPQIVLLTKLDSLPPEMIEEAKKVVFQHPTDQSLLINPDGQALCISSLSREGVDTVLNTIDDFLS